MKKEDIKRILGAAKAGGAAGGIASAFVFGLVANGRRRKAERLAREAAEAEAAKEQEQK